MSWIELAMAGELLCGLPPQPAPPCGVSHPKAERVALQRRQRTCYVACVSP